MADEPLDINLEFAKLALTDSVIQQVEALVSCAEREGIIWKNEKASLQHRITELTEQLAARRCGGDVGAGHFKRIDGIWKEVPRSLATDEDVFILYHSVNWPNK